VVLLRRGQIAGVDIPGIQQMLPGKRSFWAKWAWMVSVMVLSGIVATVVSTLTIRCGASSSQVSVRWAL
jgi:hypothetical protein